MLKPKSLKLWGIVALTALIGACSSDKVLPEGKRISVLDQVALIKPDVANGKAQIKIPAAERNTEWLQNEKNAQHLIGNIAAGLNFQKQWKTDFGKGNSKREFLLGKPIVANGTVYMVDAAGKVSAFDLKNGKEIWNVKIQPENKRAKDTAIKGVGLAMADNIIYIVTGFGYVIALNSDKGEKLWESNLETPLRIAPTADDGKLFVQSIDNKFFALNAKTGEVLWDYDIAMESTTVVGGASAAYHKGFDVVITGFSNGEIQSFSASFGTPLWSDVLVDNRRAYSSTFLHAIKASPIVEGEKVYVLGSSDVLACIDIRTGARKWEKEIGGVNTPLLAENVLYVVTKDKDLAAINKDNGDVLWSTGIDLGKKASSLAVFEPLMINDKLVLTVSDGRVFIYDAKTGTKTEEFDLDEKFNAAPIAAGGYLIFTTSNAKLIAYK